MLNLAFVFVKVKDIWGKIISVLNVIICPPSIIYFMESQPKKIREYVKLAKEFWKDYAKREGSDE